jgi:para-aminobenzoate synthetase/4-amino-4-deoxychorismate lyase
MELIRQLETEPRGVYCGAIGYAAPGAGGMGTAVFNVAIRTAVLENGAGHYAVGSGVVWDSEADAEYDECLLKARVLTDLAR